MDSILTSARFWQQTAVRCIRTFAQGAGGVLAASATGLLSANWQQAAGTGAYAAALALLMSLEKIEELPADTAEEAAVDAILRKSGVDSGAPLPDFPHASSPPPAPPTQTAPPPWPAYSTPPTYAPALPPAATDLVIMSGYPGLGDPA